MTGVVGAVYDSGGHSASSNSTRETLRIQAEAAGSIRPARVGISSQ
jgi:hypothetical protein